MPSKAITRASQQQANKGTKTATSASQQQASKAATSASQQQQKLIYADTQGDEMLILTRKPGETIVIDNNIKVTILGVEGKQIRIGIDAPKEVPVHREEIFNKIRAEKESLEVVESAG